MSEVRFKSLIRKRGTIKASVTSFKTFLKAFENNFPLNEANIIQLRDRLGRIEPLIIEFSEIQNEIETICDDDALDQQYNEREMFEDNFGASVSNAKVILAANQRSQPIQDFNAPLSSHPREEQLISQLSVPDIPRAVTENYDDTNSELFSASRKSGQNDFIQGVKLPTIELPKFDGAYESWLEFRDTFESLIHRNGHITDIQKYHYLRASLQGNAAQVIKSIEFTSCSYKLAWNALCERFNNKKLLIHNHVKSLFTLDSIQKESSFKIRKLLDNTLKHLRSLDQLEQESKYWDTLLVYMITSKLDFQSLREWERYSAKMDNFPSWNDLKSFLKSRADFLETIELKNVHDTKYKPADNKSRAFIATNAITRYKCNFCKGDHNIYTCKEFLQLSISDRIDFSKKQKLCQNCLRTGHSYNIKLCKVGPCRICKSWHNTLLHPKKEDPETTIKEISPDETRSCFSAIPYTPVTHVFLSTAIVSILDQQGKQHSACALLDCGSQSSFITYEMIERLGLQKINANLSLFGINNSMSKIHEKCEVEIHSNHTSFVSSLTCFILHRITGLLPSTRINVKTLEIPNNIVLANTQFNEPQKIDILIGADLFWNILRPGIINLGKNQPILQETLFGWVIAGPLGIPIIEQTNCNLAARSDDLHDLLAQFWEIEEYSDVKSIFESQLSCEKYFQETTIRDKNGRFIVSMPLKQSASILGDSKIRAKRQFHHMEQRLQQNEVLKNRYVEFMDEYESLGHMSEIRMSDTNFNISSPEYFMPHHGVLREESLTTKLRVVFNASAPTTSGLSLNDLQLVGPVIQNDLFAIILRFRKHAYVVSADIAKMYRQVMIEPSQRCLQKIFWRADPSDELKTFCMNTVTYGQAAASFLSIRCLFELAKECEFSSPEISRIIREDFYVDDLLTGGNSIEYLSIICKEIKRVLEGGCFELRKWFSNEPKVLEGLDKSELAFNILEFGEGQYAKTLGLTWSCHSDMLLYNVTEFSKQENPTKRSVLSHISKIFDPLGLLSPYIIKSKILMQKLWMQKISWDDFMPSDLQETWNCIQGELHCLNNLQIPRLVLYPNYVNVQLHGFSDASESAYGACIYLRSSNEEGKITVRLLCSKSRVAPIKSLTIPKLELCGALLLSELFQKVQNSIYISFNDCYFWSDSTIVLSWINSALHTLKTFEANRVSKIQKITSSYSWRHVPTKDNPADLVSRGVLPKQLIVSDLWWFGPEWLKSECTTWPNIKIDVDNLPGMRREVNSCSVTISDSYPFNSFSNFDHLQRVTAYILRFKNNCLSTTENRQFGILTLLELSNSLKCLAKLAQRESFPHELDDLIKKKPVSPKSSLLCLTPFLDDEGLLRAGGRLKNSTYSFEKKHPIILCSKHPFTKLIFTHYHLRLFHVGPQQLLSAIRDEFWPIGGRNLAKHTIRKCLTCFRFNPALVQPIMGNLPKDRVSPNKPFHVVGVDYAGPFLIKDRKGRGCKVTKCYVSLFVCFSTKSIHIELVSSLTTESFIMALRRFVSRRGKPYVIHSDRGSNFIGANKELGRYILSHTSELNERYMHEGIQWKFLPSHSPHLGGLWEAGVKSFKHHLKRVMGNITFTFEELETVLVQIEAILNSRPLCPISSDPNDLSSLTPAHFLIGKSLIAAPDVHVESVPINRLTRYQLLQQICQHVWKRWTKEYVSELQVRSKWKSSQGQLREGSLVLVKDDNSLPLDWKLGRILKVLHGSDGHGRIATIKVRNGIIQRSFPKICPLPEYSD